jgi:hypothetical protein
MSIQREMTLHVVRCSIVQWDMVILSVLIQEVLPSPLRETDDLLQKLTVCLENSFLLFAVQIGGLGWSGS